MEMMGLAFLSGLFAGAAIVFLHERSTDRMNAWYVWYRNGYNDGYEKGKREAEGKE